jgi:hypothetical protein
LLSRQQLSRRGDLADASLNKMNRVLAPYSAMLAGTTS